MKKINLLIAALISIASFSQNNHEQLAQKWVDSVFNSLTEEERIAQLMVIRAHSNLGTDHIAKVTEEIQKYNVGALCFFQGGPVRQAILTNFYQSIAKTPLMITIDAEWGVGMRLDSVDKFPYQLTLGALSEGPLAANQERLIYEMGIAVGQQCKRLGIQVNYAPVVDINNNPQNPVIGFRSFGEDKNKVIRFGIAYMKGMQDAGIMACAKHFPGHGDVDVDSHLDLPVVNKSKEQLDSMELEPFREIFKAGIGSVMIAHLSVPAYDTESHRATSISKKTVTGVLRDELGFNGLTFTDALEMKGVAKYFPGGVIAVEALIAGNDMLCLPESVPETIEAVKKAIDENRLTWDEIDAKVKKVLMAKYKLGLAQWKPVDTTNLVRDLNAKTDEIRYRAARQTMTLVKNESKKPTVTGNRTAYVAIGAPALTYFGKALQKRIKSDNFLFSYSDSVLKADSILRVIKTKQYNQVVVSVSGYNLRPANNYGISNAAIDFFKMLQKFYPKNYIFGNVLAITNFLSASYLVACYQDDEITQYTAADLYFGDIAPKGTLPVSVDGFPFGYSASSSRPGYATNKFYQVDSIARDGLDSGAYPGAVVLAAKNGKIVYQKAYGHYEFNPSSARMSIQSIFDLASVTKTSATTVSIMKLYEQGKINLYKTLGDYLPVARGTDKAHLKIKDILLHQAGLIPDVHFYKFVRDSITHLPNPAIISAEQPGFNIRVAENLYLRNDWMDTAFQLVLNSPLGPSGKYVYSDLDFILLGKVVEAITRMPLEKYVQKTFYVPMGMKTTGFKPRERFSLNRIVPTEWDTLFRWQMLWGDVHDYSASVFGGVAGHAGLFSSAGDLFKLYQMLLNGGVFNGKHYLKSTTIKLFTAYQSKISRRGYGFDKPEKDNAERKQPYPSALASPLTFGHTGWTGNCVWVDPKYKMIFIFLSNRVQSSISSGKLSEMNIRGKIQDVIIEKVK